MRARLTACLAMGWFFLIGGGSLSGCLEPSPDDISAFSGDSVDSVSRHSGDPWSPSDHEPFSVSSVSSGTRPNILVVMSDDQRADTLWAMPNVGARLASEGVTFTNARTSSPMCCPARASFLSGGFYSGETGVLGNLYPNGGSSLFESRTSIAARLQDSGYHTGLIGKYLNQYGSLGSVVVPSGWNIWWGAGSFLSYWDYNVVRGGSDSLESVGSLVHYEDRYLTDQIMQEGVSFVLSATEPFFLLVTPYAPHMPCEVRQGDEAGFADFAFRGPGFMEADLSDKPAWAATAVEVTPGYEAAADYFARCQLGLLQSLDQGVGRLVDAVEQRGLMDNTVIVYVSDNGYLWGEHRLLGKTQPYGASLSVPLVVRVPGTQPRQDSVPLSANLSLAATIQDWAGLDPIGQGTSLVPRLRGESAATSVPVLSQLGEPTLPAFSVAEIDGWRLILWATGDIEFYDLANDPGEMESVSAAPPAGSPYDELLQLARDNFPLVQVPTTVPMLTRGIPMSHSLTAAGGVPPHEWSIHFGRLPTGLSLNTATGELYGAPIETGNFEVVVQLQDAGFSSYTGLRHASIVPYQISVDVVVAALRRPPRAQWSREGILLDVVLTQPALVEWRWGTDTSLDDVQTRTKTDFKSGRLLVPIEPEHRVWVELLLDGVRAWSGWVGR